MSKSKQTGPFKKELIITLDKKRKLVFGMKAHWFLKNEYNMSFSDLSKINKNDTGDFLLALAYILHSLLITEYPDLSLDPDIFKLIDTVGLESLVDALQSLLNE